MSYPNNLYSVVMGDNCKKITIDQFKEVLANMKIKKFDNLERYIIDSIYVHEKTISSLKYELGFKNSSAIYSRRDRIIRMIREHINLKYCTRDDMISLFVGKELLKQSKHGDCTVAEAILRYSDKKYIYRNYYDECIAYILLQHFSYKPYLINMYALRERYSTIEIYARIYADLEWDGDKGFTFEHLYVRNINRVITYSMYAMDNGLYYIMSKIDAGLRYICDKDELAKLTSEYYRRFICDPDGLYSADYFEHRRPIDIELEAISVSIPVTLYNKCKTLLEKTNSANLAGFICLVLTIDSTEYDILTTNEKEKLKLLLANIKVSCVYIKEVINSIKAVVEEAKTEFS